MESQTITHKSRQLKQVDLTTTNATSIYAPPYGLIGSIRLVFISNYANTAINFTLFQDSDGNTASNATSINYTPNIADSFMIDIPEPGIIVDGSLGGTLFAQANVANCVSVTLYGEERSK